MVAPRQITGSKEQVIEQIGRLQGEHISALVWVDDPSAFGIQSAPPLTDEQVAEIFAQMDADASTAVDVDISREAMYTRKPGE